LAHIKAILTKISWNIILMSMYSDIIDELQQVEGFYSGD